MVNCSVHTRKRHPASNLILSCADLRHTFSVSDTNLQLRNIRGIHASYKASKPSDYLRKLGSWQSWGEAKPLIQVVWIIPWQIPPLCSKHWHRGTAAPPPCPCNALCTATEVAEHCTDPQVLLNAFAFPLKISFSLSHHKIKTHYWRKPT